MSDPNNMMFRTYKSDAEERADPARVTGTVVVERVPCEPHYADDDNPLRVHDVNMLREVTTQDTCYIRDDRDGKLYYFCNTIHKNPFPGLGSQQRCYLLGVDDVARKTPYMMLMNMDSNACNDAWVGPVLVGGQKVTFIPKRPEELVCEGVGDVVLLTQGANCKPPSATTLLRERVKAGVACDIALDAGVDQEAKLYAPRL
jgi:hypothetical protein